MAVLVASAVGIVELGAEERARSQPLVKSISVAIPRNIGCSTTLPDPINVDASLQLTLPDGQRMAPGELTNWLHQREDAFRAGSVPRAVFLSFAGDVRWQQVIEVIGRIRGAIDEAIDEDHDDFPIALALRSENPLWEEDRGDPR